MTPKEAMMIEGYIAGNWQRFEKECGWAGIEPMPLFKKIRKMARPWEKEEQAAKEAS